MLLVCVARLGMHPRYCPLSLSEMGELLWADAELTEWEMKLAGAKL